MYRVAEPKIKTDDYGEVIKVEDFTLTFQDDGAKSKDTKMEVEEAPEVPSKCAVEEREVLVRCSISYIDFEGLADGRSVRELLLAVAPKKTVCYLLSFIFVVSFFFFFFFIISPELPPLTPPL